MSRKNKIGMFGYVFYHVEGIIFNEPGQETAIFKSFVVFAPRVTERFAVWM